MLPAVIRSYFVAVLCWCYSYFEPINRTAILWVAVYTVHILTVPILCTEPTFLAEVFDNPGQTALLVFAVKHSSYFSIVFVLLASALPTYPSDNDNTMRVT